MKIKNKLIIKIFLLNILTLTMLVNLCKSQKLIKAFEKNGKIFGEYYGIKEIVTSGKNTLIAFSSEKNFIIYQRLDRKSIVAQKEPNQEQLNYESNDQYSIRYFDTETNVEKILFKTSFDKEGGTKIVSANSDNYPFNNLDNIKKPIYATSEEKLFFQTSAWTTSDAVLFYDLKMNKLFFFKAGDLINVTSNGVEVVITAIDYETINGEKVSRGRYWQKRLFDFNGKFIKNLSPKE